MHTLMWSCNVHCPAAARSALTSRRHLQRKGLRCQEGLEYVQVMKNQGHPDLAMRFIASAAKVTHAAMTEVHIPCILFVENQGPVWAVFRTLSIDAWSDVLLYGQGREAEVVVFSTVRRNPHGSIGFVSDERRLNVAITRPRRWIPSPGAPSLHH